MLLSSNPVQDIFQSHMQKASTLIWKLTYNPKCQVLCNFSMETWTGQENESEGGIERRKRDLTSVAQKMHVFQWWVGVQYMNVAPCSSFKNVITHIGIGTKFLM